MPDPVTAGAGLLSDLEAQPVPAASAEVMAPALPGRPSQVSSARSDPGDAGWPVQGRSTGTPRTPATAHSMCGQSAGGAE